jgi:hypothetical protein
MQISSADERLSGAKGKVKQEINEVWRGFVVFNPIHAGVH